jgi:hypothetical protein
MIEVLSVDDHALLREGIAALVNAESDMKLVAEATNGQEAIEKDAVLERHRVNHQHSKRIPQRPNHRADDVRRRCLSRVAGFIFFKSKSTAVAPSSIRW